MNQDFEYATRQATDRSLTIIHCVRSTIGGIFRHISDLIQYQAACGHRVGLICDSLTGGDFEDQRIAELSPFLDIGCVRLPMPRNPHPRDFFVMKEMKVLLESIDVDVVHCHGAKGGAYGRIVGKLISARRVREGGRKVVTIYCPHGGSLHFDARSTRGAFFFRLERFLERLTDSFVFVSGYELEAYAKKVGRPYKPWTIAYNGLRKEEFKPVTHHRLAVDFLYAGHMRDLKGTDVFIDAIEIANRRASRPVHAAMFGDGEDRPRYEKEVKQRKLDHRIQFYDPGDIRDVFRKGKVLVVPSRAESMPYIVLEALGACQPIIATSVGGIPEVYGPFVSQLLPPGDANVLASAMIEALDNPKSIQQKTQDLHQHIANKFTVEQMCQVIDEVYHSHLSGGTSEQSESDESETLEANLSSLPKAS